MKRSVLLLTVIALQMFAWTQFITPVQGTSGPGSHKITAEYYGAYIDYDHDWLLGDGEWYFRLYAAGAWTSRVYKHAGEGMHYFSARSRTWYISGLPTSFQCEAWEEDLGLLGWERDYTSCASITIYGSFIYPSQWPTFNVSHSGSQWRDDVKHYFKYKIYNDPPTVGSISGPSTGFRLVPYTWSAAGSDPEGDSITYEWLVDGVPQPATGSSLTYAFTTLGTHTIRVRTRDYFDAYSDWNTVTITVELAAPLALDDSYVTEAGTTLSVTIEGVLLNDNDLDGDVLTAWLDEGPSFGTLTLFSDGSFSYTPYFWFVGVDTFTYHASDGALDSNVATVSVTVGLGETVDTTPPVTGIALSNDLGSHGWYTSPVTVTLLPTDAHTMVAETKYCLDSTTWNTYSGPFLVSTEGNTTVSYYSTDIAGNVEDLHTQNIGIDMTPPQSKIHPGIHPEIDPPWYQTWYGTESVELQLYTLEKTSNFVGTYRIDDGPWWPFTNGSIATITGEGPHLLEYHSTDLAGHVEPIQQHPIGIDLSAPTVSYQLDGTLGTENWWQTIVDVTLAAEDSFSGVAGFLCWVDGDDAPIDGYDITLTSEGIHTISWEVWDHMPWTTTGETTIKVDLAPPETELSYVQVPYVGSIVTLTYTDSMSGVLSAFYRVNEGPLILYDGPFTLSTGGIVPVDFCAIDKAGHIELMQTEPVEVDVLPPETTLHPDGVLGLNGWYVSDVEITLTAIDDLMGVDEIYYSYDGIFWETYTIPFDITDEDLTTVHYYAIDNVGNQEETKIAEIYIDRTRPTTTLLIGPPVFGADPYYVSSHTPFTLEAVDPISGVDYTEYRVDKGSWIMYTVPFTVPNLGPHMVSYRSLDSAGNVENTHTVAIIVKATKLTYTGDFTGVYSDPVPLHAQLIDMATQLPVPGKPIVFTPGSQTLTSLTGSDGVASVTPVLDQPAGIYSVSAVFTSDSEYVGSSDTHDFNIEKETAFVTYTGSTVVPTTVETITLRATVMDDVDGYWGDLTKIYATFTIYGVPMDLSSPVVDIGPHMVEVTEVDGVGVVVVEISNLPESSYLITVSLKPEDNNYYWGANSDLVTIVVYEPTGEFVTGGGWIWDSEGHKGNFGFNVKYQKTGLPKGQAIYVFRDGDWEYIIKSNAWLGMAIVDEHAFFEAKCVVQQYNSKTGELVWDEGNYHFRIDVWDNAENDNDDVYQIRVYDKNGLVYHESGFDPYGSLQGGNIMIHVDKEK